MKAMPIVMLTAASVLGGCAAPMTASEHRDCAAAGFVPQTHTLKVRTAKGAPVQVVVPRLFKDVEMKAFVVGAGDTVVWQLKGDFTIAFPVEGPSGSPESYKERGAVRVTVPCRDYCSDPKAIQGAGVCYRPYKYNVENSSGALDPMIVVER